MGLSMCDLGCTARPDKTKAGYEPIVPGSNFNRLRRLCGILQYTQQTAISLPQTDRNSLASSHLHGAYMALRAESLDHCGFPCLAHGRSLPGLGC